MQKITSYGRYGLLLSMLLVTACKKVIDIDLKSATAQIVIEGNITDAPGAYAVLISKTVNFSANNTYPPVTDAYVTITDSTSHITDTLTQVDPGVYVTGQIMGFSNHTYYLNVYEGNKVYSASSTMPIRVDLDSISFAENIGFNNKEEINAIVNFPDPAGITNYYSFTESVNNRLIPNIFVFEDRLSDGRYIEYPLYNDSSYLNPGDTLQLTMNCVDENTYNYFNTLINVTGGNNFQAVTPANPVTNLSNGALGYFSAHTTQRASILVY
jgi:Domain of unknown function (DUF4249)